MAYNGISDGEDLDRCHIAAEGQGEAGKVVVLDASKNVEGLGNVSLDVAKAFGIGDPDTDGSYRFIIDGIKFALQKRISGNWVEKWAQD